MAMLWQRAIDRVWNPQGRGVRLAALLAALSLAVSAHAAIRAIIDHPLAPPPRPQPTGYEAEAHFPGAAMLYAVEDDGSLIGGATGTAELPDMPLPPGAADLPADASIHPAQPFSMRLASTIDRARALQCLTTAIYYEAAREPTDGQRAVAQVILNRVRHPAFPATVCGVVYQGSERSGCQFSFACDGSMARPPQADLWRRAAGVADQALSGAVFAPVGEATHYHTYAVTPRWNRQLVMTAAIGAHFFHRWQGWWGTPAAFTQQYKGGEPEPGPHLRAPSPATAATLAMAPGIGAPIAGTIPPVPGATPTPAGTAPSDIQPGYAQSGSVRADGASAEGPALSGQILDRWRDSGKPLH